MTSSSKAMLWLSATFVTGVIFGMLFNGALAQRRDRAVDRARGPGGFVAEMERVIQPRDSTQRAALRPMLEAADRDNRAIVDGARRSMGGVLDSLRRAMAPLLDDAQRERVSHFGGPRGGPPGLGRPDSPQGPPPGAPPGLPNGPPGGRPGDGRGPPPR